MRGAKRLTRAQQKALRPLQILEAAFEEFVKSGYSATRVEDVAERVGVTKGTVYVYFETKEKLFEAMIQHISVPFEEVLESAALLHGSSFQKLISFLGLLYDQIAENRKTRELLRFVISEGHRFPDLIDEHHHQFIAPIIAKVEELLQQGAASGEFREIPTGFPDLVIAPILTTTVLRLIFDKRMDVDRDGLLNAHAEMMLHALTVAK